MWTLRKRGRLTQSVSSFGLSCDRSRFASTFHTARTKNALSESTHMHSSGFSPPRSTTDTSFAASVPSMRSDPGARQAFIKLTVRARVSCGLSIELVKADNFD